MKKYINPNRANWNQFIERPLFDTKALSTTIDEIFEQVNNRGDEALKELTLKFDKVYLEDFKVTENEITEASKQVDKNLKKAIEIAKNNIEKFHRSQLTTPSKIETSPGVFCWQEVRGIDKVGLYIPGGTAPLFSTVLMLAIPAQIADCQNITMCTPPDKNGQINPSILYAASIAGVHSIYKVGGAQAIAAMTLGTEIIPSVYKIFGPGNQYVTAAKQKAQQLGCSIDMPAGPSEVLVWADASADAAFIASDLLSQAEHGVDSQVICVVDDTSLIEPILAETKKQLALLPRKEIASKALENSSIISLTDEKEAIDFVNLYAPEHLIICLENEKNIIPKIRNAGSVFLGNYTPESAGDYASGTNHTLPTNGFAKSYSGVNMDAFVKKITFQKITQKGIQNLGPHIMQMAEAEELVAHKRAVEIRLKNL